LARPENKIAGALLFFFLANGPLVNGFREVTCADHISLIGRCIVALECAVGRTGVGCLRSRQIPLHWRVVGNCDHQHCGDRLFCNFWRMLNGFRRTPLSANIKAI
jgi:hypothetical protein